MEGCARKWRRKRWRSGGHHELEGKRRGDVGFENEKEKQKRKRMESFFCAVCEVLTDFKSFGVYEFPL